MKVATITCLGQHPKGLPIHLRNLHWAVDRPHESHVVTKRGWNLKGDCQFTVQDEPLGVHSHFWRWGVPELIRSLDADVIVTTQLDMFYHRHLGELIDTVYKDNCVVMNSDPYGWDIYKDGKIIYPRVWEGGLIVRRERLLDQLDRGCCLGYVLTGQQTIDLIRERFDGEYITEPGNMKRPLNEVPWMAPIDTLFEFQLWCYYDRVDVRRAKILTHMMRPECIHRRYPWCYDEITPWQLELLKSEHADVIGNTMFMYTLSGVTSFNEHVRPLVTGNPIVHNCIDFLSPHAHEWMSPQEHEVFEDIKTYIRRQVPFF